MNNQEQEVLLLNNSDKSFDYCKYNKNANVKLHEDVIINNNHSFYAYLFAKDIDRANIERLQEVVINCGDGWDIYHFAFIQNSNKEELFKALLKLGDQYYIDSFIKDIPLSEELKELVIFI